MLIDKYLPVYDFNECHAVEVTASPDGIYEKMILCDFKESILIRFLFRLRGIPKHLYTIAHLTNMGFTKLDEQPGHEILYGMVTASPMFNTCKSNITPSEFIQDSDPATIKAVINFKLQGKSESRHIISTETRVWCGSKKMRSRFKYYWFFIKPFSQFIRRSMLKQMKLQIQ